MFGHVPACLPAFPEPQKCLSHTNTLSHTFSLSLCPKACSPKKVGENDMFTLRTSSQEKSSMSGWNMLYPRGLDQSMEDNERERETGLLSDISHSLYWCILGKGALDRQTGAGSIILDSETSSPLEILSSSCYSFPPSFTHLHGHTDTHSHLPTLSAHRGINC